MKRVFLEAALKVVIFLEEDKEYRASIACLAALAGIIIGRLTGQGAAALVLLFLLLAAVYLVIQFGEKVGVSAALEVMADEAASEEDRDLDDSQVQDPGLETPGQSPEGQKILKIHEDGKGR